MCCACVSERLMVFGTSVLSVGFRRRGIASSYSEVPCLKSFHAKAHSRAGCILVAHTLCTYQKRRRLLSGGVSDCSARGGWLDSRLPSRQTRNQTETRIGHFQIAQKEGQWRTAPAPSGVGNPPGTIGWQQARPTATSKHREPSCGRRSSAVKR